uniref:NADH-ubiquinone oxidoreductase chain 4L n=1 Tax=Actinopyga lecanora TaxID=571811 RepID=A0A7U1ARF6_9ECHN|nr:NADH dehydrogenase subunit 4L [Actinopyga lecanora]QQY85559.1 NADH dehydrogenase subunit 4L [Actinopyga lecanora]QWE50455.1 NADH dehydrogenase subunit 4L [Actinopyga lecanora]
MNILPTVLFSLFLLGIIGVIINRLHLLSLLLCLELLLISLFLNISSWSQLHESFSSLSFSTLLLTLSACEASAGLALMVSLSRSHNTDLLVNINLLQT